MDNTIQQNQYEKPPLNSDEKLLAMLSHFSIFLGGIILPIILYFVQKDRSKFVAFHALQAIFFHLLYAGIIVLSMVALVVVFGASGVFLDSNSDELPVSFFMGMGLFYIVLIGSIFVAIAYGIYMGVKAYDGDTKKYILVGKWASKKVYGN